MNRRALLPLTAFAVGLAAVAWTAAGTATANPLALAITLLIGAFYVLGAVELQRFHRATTALVGALTRLQAAPATLGPWLAEVPAPLQNPVRLRIEGERVALPGPALTPYIVGLLVLLGMLGTFLGMVVTLAGTGAALEHAQDLAAVRATLSAPVKGLGLAFGTSVVGVATSAMLGLMSALCRRERLQAGQWLDTRIATTLQAFSRTHQREQQRAQEHAATLALLQRQADAMPVLADRLQAMMTALEHQGQALQQRLGDEQARFHAHTEATYGALASSVQHSLQRSLADSAQLAATQIQPVVEATMAGIAREAAALHTMLAHTVQQQLEGLTARVEAGTATTAGLWQAALEQHRQAGAAMARELHSTLQGFTGTFETRASALVEGLTTRLDAARHQLQAESAARDEQRLAAWTASVAALAEGLQREWQQAGAATLRQQEALCTTLTQTAHDLSAHTAAQGRQTLAEIERLVQAAAAAPQAAAEVIAQLRQQLSDSLAHDNALIDERQRMLATLGTLLDAVNHASTEQRSAIDALVSTSAQLLERIGSRFGAQAEAHAAQISEAAGQIGAGAAEVASLGEAFGGAVALFAQSNETLVAHLQRIEAALGRSLTRSDEQLAYYVAQAREVIDLSILSQKQIVDDLQRLAGAPA